MADALIIALRLDGLNPVLGGLNQVAQAMNALGGSGAGGGVGGQARNIQQRALGPFSRLQQKQQDLVNAQQQGNAIAIRDAQYQVLMAQRQADRANRMLNGTLSGGPSFADRLNMFIRSTRFGGGGGLGGLNPLIGRGLDVLGMGRLSTPIGLAAAALGGLALAARSAAGILSDISRSRYTGGGSFADASKARALGTFLGEDVASLARGFAERLGSDPYAMAAGARFGIIDYGGGNPMAGKLNTFENFFKMIEALRGAATDQEAMRLARMFGPEAEKALPLRDVSPDVYNRLINAQKDMFSRDRVQAAADFNAEMAILQLNFQQLLTSLTPVIEVLNSILAFVNKVLARTFENPGGLLPGSEYKRNPYQEQRQEIQRNTDALRSLNTTLRGFIGGGNRARNAVPAGWLGNAAYAQANRMWDGDARALGAFTVG